MGLFKPKVTPKVADIFTAEERQTIQNVIGLKAKTKGYGKYNDMAETLMQVADAPGKDYSWREWNGIIFSAGAMTKLEPTLAPALKAAIDRFHEFKKK